MTGPRLSLAAHQLTFYTYSYRRRPPLSLELISSTDKSPEYLISRSRPRQNLFSTGRIPHTHYHNEKKNIPHHGHNDLVPLILQPIDS